jgi:hypothetical protein
MRICNQCGVSINSEETSCPLCGQDTSAIDTKAIKAYPEVSYKIIKDFLYRLFAFLSIAIGGISVFLNLYTSPKTPWSLIVIVSLLYLWGIYFYNIKRYKNRGQSLLMQTIGICMMVFTIDLSTGFSKWSTSFVLPFVILSASIMGSILVLTKPFKIYEYLVYEVALIILGVIPFILFLFELTTVSWPSIACLIGSILVLLSIFLFSDRDAIQEVKRRLHY